MKIAYFGVDFLGCKILKSLSIYSVLLGCVENSPEIYISDDFKIVFSANYPSDEFCEFRILNIIDSVNNKVGSVQLSFTDKHNRIDKFELTSTFFHFYFDYLDLFLSFFEFDRFKDRMVTRIDYCVDILHPISYIRSRLRSREHSDFTDYIRDGVDTGFTIKFDDRNELRVYDKKIDTFKKKKSLSRDIFGNFPFSHYVNDTNSYTRIELEKKGRSLRELSDTSDASLDRLLRDIQTLYKNFLRRYIDIDFSGFKSTFNTSTYKKEFSSFEKVKYKKKQLYISNISAYVKNLQSLMPDYEVFESLCSMIPGLDEYAVNRAINGEWYVFKKRHEQYINDVYNYSRYSRRFLKKEVKNFGQDI